MQHLLREVLHFYLEPGQSNRPSISTRSLRAENHRPAQSFLKTIKPYIHWLVDGHVPHEVEQLYDDSSVLHGVIFVLSIIQSYFEWKHGLSEKPRTDILASAEHIVTILTQDYRQHMERKIQEQKARILAKAGSEEPHQ